MALAMLVLLISSASTALAGKKDVGRWRFKHDDRPVKAVVIGGSVAAWQRGNFGQLLQASCDRLEVVNRAKSKLGALQLKRRFLGQVLKNRRLKLADQEESWLIFMGGLNSVYSPERTNRQVGATYRKAHEAGLKVMGLTVGPWGAEHDRRWKGVEGWRYQELTRKIVDFVMGRLTRAQAYGEKTERPTEAVDQIEQPDIAVDLYDSPLRAADAELRDESRTRRRVRRMRRVKKELAALSEDEREAALEARVGQVREIPRWYLRRELQAFDHIHPNEDGHRVIGGLACEQAPPSWGCDCARLNTLRWDRRQRAFVAQPPATPDPPTVQGVTDSVPGPPAPPE